jgi:hypothetical protein
MILARKYIMHNQKIVTTIQTLFYERDCCFMEKRYSCAILNMRESFGDRQTQKSQNKKAAYLIKYVY